MRYPTKGFIAVAVVVFGALTSCAPPPPKPEAAVLRETSPPWPAPRDAVSYIEKAGMPKLPWQYKPADHFKTQLIVYVDGDPVTVPPGIGVDRVRGLQAPIHTHDESGQIWVEPEEPGTFTLGQFFDLWGVRFTKDCLGNLCAGNGKRVAVYVDHQPFGGDPRQIELKAQRRIVVSYESAAAPAG
ncbi:hypothetical protein C3Y87_10945 [Carbonactinospora thermoautotrophica]|uniref:Lipoprotein n=1 Tax=Carbonactinospora thermoautotrophica TaxID=1469144 RepID=A0A132MNS2_9ACTN|nr:hypothetical protein [Carbonactinospora thermoautotrophica]KWW99492.1 hypothetical protein LI90_1128 [Carbonactinospora thermoautotrophica]MCX9191924.1 hypothetical protein [Carbonactinospora thermoautotrophica]